MPSPPCPCQLLPHAKRHLASLGECLAYHSRFVTVRTPAIDTLAKNVRTLMILGRHQAVTARPSPIVTGPAGAGKTTALLQVGRACHLAHTRRHGATATAGQVPVAYVLVPPAASAKTLATEFARHLGIPVAAGMSQVQIHQLCLSHLHRRQSPARDDRRSPPAQPPHHHRRPECRPAQRPHRTHRRHLRLRRHRRHRHPPLFTGVRGAQVAGRASLIDCAAFPARLGDPEPFRDLITAVEAALDLRHHRPGPLPQLPPTCTSAPPAASAASPPSSARPPSPPSSTAPNASPKPPSKPSAWTTSQNSTTDPTTAPGGASAPRDTTGPQDKRPNNQTEHTTRPRQSHPKRNHSPSSNSQPKDGTPEQSSRAPEDHYSVTAAREAAADIPWPRGRRNAGGAGWATRTARVPPAGAAPSVARFSWWWPARGTPR